MDGLSLIELAQIVGVDPVVMVAIAAWLNNKLDKIGDIHAEKVIEKMQVPSLVASNERRAILERLKNMERRHD